MVKDNKQSNPVKITLISSLIRIKKSFKSNSMTKEKKPTQVFNSSSNDNAVSRYTKKRKRYGVKDILSIERVSDLYLHPGAAVETIVRTPKVARIERIKALEIYKGYNHDMLDIEFGKFHSLQICIGQTSGMGYSYDVEGSINLEPINQVKGISMLERKVSKHSWNSLPGATGGYT
jgi:hypothetical protein